MWLPPTPLPQVGRGVPLIPLGIVGKDHSVVLMYGTTSTFCPHGRFLSPTLPGPVGVQDIPTLILETPLFLGVGISTRLGKVALEVIYDSSPSSYSYSSFIEK